MIDHTLGVVLTGGASRRMGRNKASIEFEGATLLDRATAVLSSVFTAVVVSAAGPIDTDVPVVVDRVPGMGPLGGLESVYGAAERRAVFLLAVDMPFVDAETVLAIADPQVAEMSVRLPIADGRRQPLCGVYGAGLESLVARCLDGEDRSMECLLQRADVHEINNLADDLFANVNTVEDLDAAITRTDQRRSTR